MASIDPYSIRTSDPAVAKSVSYLVSLGAPQPTFSDIAQVFPGGSYVDSEVTFADAHGHKCVCNAGLMATFPNIAANDLAEHGIITLTSPLFPGVPVPGVNDATFQTAAPAAPVVTASPIGPKVYPGTPDAAGDHYYATPTDALPAGTKWTQSGTTFVKVEIPSPFGFYVYWQRQ